ncbi:MAG: ArdC-like ssDNA-binding domain-containing protein [Caloramator sp.]|nr:ArdC-like ssDNA-binding domain-containing protein [Caloramator sp.]
MDKESNELLSKIEDGIKSVMNSEKFKAFLKMQSLFHKYSFSNTMLIFLQRPDATMVAGFSTWNKLGRSIIKGEKGISILAPHPYKYDKVINKIDAKTGQVIIDPNTNEPVKEVVQGEGLTFKKVTVFDVKQTQGRELPSICNELKGNSLNAERLINAIKKISKAKILEMQINTGAKGYYNPNDNIIVINKGMSKDQTVKTLIHEYAHSILHSKENEGRHNKAEKEVQAESVAYIVANHFSIDTGEYSFEYIANYSKGKNLDELKNSFSLIQKTSSKIIEDIENMFEKELEYQDKKNIKNIKEKIIENYSNEYPAIKFISEKTAELINNLNSKSNKTFTIKEIRKEYLQLGKEIEKGINASIEKVNEFKVLKDITDGLKQAELSIRYEKQKSINKSIKIKEMEV